MFLCIGHISFGTRSRDLSTGPIYQNCIGVLGIYMYLCVFCMLIYLCWSWSSIVLVTLNTSPQCPFEWGSAAQKTGENLRCGPSIKSASSSPPLYWWVGHPGGPFNGSRSWLFSSGTPKIFFTSRLGGRVLVGRHCGIGILLHGPRFDGHLPALRGSIARGLH